MSEPPLSESEEIYPQLNYRMTTGSGRRQGGGDYLIDFEVKISATYEPYDGSGIDGELHLGDLQATMIRVARACEEDFSLFDLFDHRQEIQDFACHLFEPDYEEFIKPIREAFPYALTHEDILFIRGLVMQPVARGQRVGISALHRFITDWEGGCSLVAIEVLPMQFAGEVREGEEEWQNLSLGSFTGQREMATEKLANHYRGLGFTAVETVPYLLLCPANRQAPLEELALEDTMILSKDALDGLA